MTQAFPLLVCRSGDTSMALSTQDAGVSGMLLVIRPMRMVVMHVLLLTLKC